MNAFLGTAPAAQLGSLLETLQLGEASGTLSARGDGKLHLLLLRRGELAAQHVLSGDGTAATLESGGEPSFEGELEVRFDAQGEVDLPQVSSLAAGAMAGPLRAVPILGPGQPVPAGLVDLREFVARCKERLTTGVLVCLSGDDEEKGTVLIHEGNLAAAYFERDGFLAERSDALRLIYRYSLDPANPPLQFYPLEPWLSRILLGLALERRFSNGDPGTFTGVSVGEAGYTYYQDGTPYLLVTANGTGSGRFAPAVNVPDLELPTDPPGWETQRYTLTLRGRDALNPMTELWMQFASSHGSNARHVLETVAGGQTIEECAQVLKMELQELKPWLQKLEAEGLIRPRQARSVPTW